jgi:hypothetical protein
MSTQTISIQHIEVEDRMRKENGDLNSIMESMHERGLLQAIGVQCVAHGENEAVVYRLLWGGRRLAAAKKLGWDSIEAKICGSMLDYEASELEYLENFERKSMTWQEEAMGLYRIHSQRVRANALKGEAWGHRETGKLLGISHGNANYTIRVAKYLVDGDHEVWQAADMASALRILLARRDAEISGSMHAAKTTESSFFQPKDIEDLNKAAASTQAASAPTTMPSAGSRVFKMFLYQSIEHYDTKDAGLLFSSDGSYDDPAWTLDCLWNDSSPLHDTISIVFNDTSESTGLPFTDALRIMGFDYQLSSSRCHATE